MSLTRKITQLNLTGLEDLSGFFIASIATQGPAASGCGSIAVHADEIARAYPVPIAWSPETSVDLATVFFVIRCVVHSVLKDLPCSLCFIRFAVSL